MSLADGQICVRQDAGEVRLALEDIAWIAIDTPQATLTSALMSACMEAGIALVFTDERHTPSGMALPFHRHHRQGGIARLQMDAKDGVKKRLWQAIVRRKILNQAASLAVLGRENAETLKEIARHVEPGDPENVEARAARFYWRRLFGDFVRDDDGDLRNKMLNYGYAVVRAGVARARWLPPVFSRRLASSTMARPMPSISLMISLSRSGRLSMFSRGKRLAIARTRTVISRSKTVA